MTNVQENKMGTMSVNKLLFSMSIPMMLSMLVQSLYNIIDSMFVAQINENALTALTLVFPIQQFMIGISVGTGIGMNALLSRSLGEKNQDRVNKSATNGIFLSIVYSILFALFGLLFGGAFVRSQTSDPEIIAYSLEYLNVITICSFGMFISMIYERLLQSTGKTVYSMICQLTGAIINIILDPILIFGLFGFPKLGVLGAAIATVIGQLMSAFVGIYLNHRKNQEITFSFKGFKPNWFIIKHIYAIGIPSIIMQTIASFLTFFMNKLLISFTPTAVSVFGIYFRLQSFVFMPVFGLNNGMVPIIAYNYGAKNKKRIIDTLTLSIITAVFIMLVGLAIFQLIPSQLLGLFDASPQMIEIGVPALRRISLSFAFAGFSIICGSVFQALGNGFLSLLTSITRQVIFILPLAYIFGHFFGLNAIWYAFPIAEISALILSGIFLKHILKTKVQVLDYESAAQV